MALLTAGQRARAAGLGVSRIGVNRCQSLSRVGLGVGGGPGLKLHRVQKEHRALISAWSGSGRRQSADSCPSGPSSESDSRSRRLASAYTANKSCSAAPRSTFRCHRRSSSYMSLGLALSCPPPFSTYLRRFATEATTPSSAAASTTATQPPVMAATKIDGTALAKRIREGLRTTIAEKQQINPRFKPCLKIIQGLLPSRR